MKYAIISDIHANYAALRNVIADAKEQGAEKFVCLGDVVGYGPQPAETLELLRKTCAVVVAGNHDDAVCGRGDSSDFVDLAKDAVKRHRAALSEGQLGWLRSLPYSCKIEGATIAHGDVFDPPKFYYILDEEGAEANFKETDARLAFVGHTHEPAIFLTGNSGKVYKTTPQDFTIEEHKRYIVNPGSVGYPRDNDGQCFSSYVIYDSTEKTVAYRYLPFQVSSVMQRGDSAAPLGRRIVVAASVLVAILAVASAWLFMPRAIVAVDDPELMVETREMPLDPDIRSVSPNISLQKDSDPVQLRIAFETASGEVSGLKTFIITQSWPKKKVKVPPGSSLARFTLTKTKRGDSAKIVSFAPSASVK